MIAYPGINPLTVSTTPGAGANGVVVNAGSYGRNVVPVVVEDGDIRSAANHAAADQADRDAIVWLSWRAIDICNGGVYTFTADIATSNNWTFNGNTILSFTKIVDNSSVVGGATLAIGDSGDGPGTIDVTAYGAINVDSGGDITLALGASLLGSAGCIVSVEGTAAHPTTITLLGDNTYPATPHMTLALTDGTRLAVDADSVIDSSGEIRRSGVAAVNVLRTVVTAPTVSTSPFNMLDADTWLLPTTHAGIVTLTMGSGFTAGACEATFYTPDTDTLPFDYIIDFGFGEVLRFVAGTSKTASATVRWTGPGGHFIVISRAGGTSTGITEVVLGGVVWG